MPARIPDHEVPKFSCEHCGKEIERRRIIRRGTSRGFVRARFCGHSCANLFRGPSKGTIHHTGYRVMNMGKRGSSVAQHRLIMEKMIGRPLLKGETVHHKNGIRDDNRPENLELWSSRHGGGQRVDERIADAREFLSEQGFLTNAFTVADLAVSALAMGG